MPSNSTSSSSILAGVGTLVGFASNASLPLVGAFQLASCITTVIERAIPSNFEVKAESYPFYMMTINGVFGAMGLSYGIF